MKAAKFFVSAVATAAVIGAIGVSYAQTSTMGNPNNGGEAKSANETAGTAGTTGMPSKRGNDTVAPSGYTGSNATGAKSNTNTGSSGMNTNTGSSGTSDSSTTITKRGASNNSSTASNERSPRADRN